MTRDEVEPLVLTSDRVRRQRRRRVTEPVPTPELRFGRWQDVLADVGGCDMVLADPPYSERTATGYRSQGFVPQRMNGALRCGVEYGHITENDARELATSWSPRTAHWAVIFCDHIAFRWHEAAWSGQGWYTFPPVIWAKDAAPPRFRGDGPASQVDYILVARPRSYEGNGSLPGWYRAITPRHGHEWTGVTGNKDPAALRRLICDYTEPGDLVVDPYAGSGTTALACALEGRRCVTCECDPGRYEIARKRLAAPHTEAFDFDEETR